MRAWIDLIETANEKPPKWFTKGTSVSPEHWDRASDFLESPEFDYEWRFCDVPLDILFPRLLREPKEREDRLREINAWVDTTGIEMALRDQPPLALITATRIELLDGNHRVSIAKERGLRSCPMVVGFNSLEHIAEDTSGGVLYDGKNFDTEIAAAHYLLSKIHPDDVGNEQIGSLFVYYEGFAEDCWVHYHMRVEAGELLNLDAYAVEIIADWKQRIGLPVNTVESGWTAGGEEDEPDVFFAIFQAA